jgi:glycosyltransferase involved in cell wall biosynthesis
MLTGESVVCVSSIDWDFNRQGHQEIMARLAAQGNRVLFIENTGVRPATFRDLSRLRHRVRSWGRGTRGVRKVQDDLCVYSPVIIPSPYSRVARWINRRIMARAVRRWLRAVGASRPILWTFLPTPLVHDLIRELDPELTVYYCVDDLPSSSPPARRLGASEAALLGTADLVFVTAEKLRARAARVRNRVHMFPFGVAYEPFARIRSGLGTSPAELRAVPRPIVGYVGGLNHKLDQELLADVARRLPEVSFVLLGPVETDVSALARCPNIRLLGARPHADVPSYIKEFAVGIVPYRLTEYTAHVYPNKLNEYLAMGLPVVSTDLPEIRRFNALDGDLIAIARDAAGFSDAIQMVLKEVPSGRIEQRIQAARRNSWGPRIAEMSMLVEQELARRRAGTATGIGGRVTARGPA